MLPESTKQNAVDQLHQCESDLEWHAAETRVLNRQLLSSDTIHLPERKPRGANLFTYYSWIGKYYSIMN